MTRMTAMAPIMARVRTTTRIHGKAKGNGESGVTHTDAGAERLANKAKAQARDHVRDTKQESDGDWDRDREKEKYWHRYRDR